MEDLKLNIPCNSSEKSNTNRYRLIAGEGFSLFHGLPNPTKLRYLRGHVLKKTREIKAIKKKFIRNLQANENGCKEDDQLEQLILFNKHTSDFDSIGIQLETLIKKGTFEKKAKKVHSEILKEEE